MKGLLKKVFIFFCCAFLFFGLSYVYLYYNFNKESAEADQKQYNVPYEQKPENKSIAFVFADNSACLVHLDFDNMGIRLLNIEEFEGNTAVYSGYSCDYTVQVSYQLIEGIVDRVGGVNLDIDGQIRRYTGIQVVDIISHGCDEDLKKDILLEIFTGISKNNFTKDDFVYIVENSKTDLSVIDCIYWVDYIKDMSCQINFIN
ncbi:MAG: hypothetical protein Q4B40_04030 [Clostridia bacterium]|nr:hypothetical protein [Clostridia bacterium]